MEVPEVATVRTTLNLGITSSSNMKGVDEAIVRVAELKREVESLNGERLNIRADMSAVDRDILDVRVKLRELQQQMREGEIDASDEGAKAAIRDLKAELAELRDKKLSIQLEDAKLKADIAQDKAELDALTRDRHVKVDMDTAVLGTKLRRLTDSMRQDAQDAESAWRSAGTNIRQSALSIGSAIALLAPAAVPLTAAALSVGGSLVSAFTGASLAGGAFGFVLGSTVKQAGQIASKVENLNTTLAAQKDYLATLTPGTLKYDNALAAVQKTQFKINETYASQGTAVESVAKNISALSNEWATLLDKMAPITAPFINAGFTAIRMSLQELPRIIGAVASALEPMRQAFVRFFATANGTPGAGLQRLTDWIATTGVRDFQLFMQMVHNLGVSFAQMVSAFSGNGTTLMQWLVRITDKLDKWGAGGGFQRFAEYVKSVGPQVSSMLEALGRALGHLIDAANGVSGPSLTALTVGLDMLASLPVGAIQAVYVAFVAYKGLNFLGALFDTIKAGVIGVKAAVAGAQVFVTAFSAGLAGMDVAGAEGALAKLGVALGGGWKAAVTGAKGALEGLKLGFQGTAVAAGESTVKLVANKIAIAAQAVASGVASAATRAWNAVTTVFNTLTSLSTYRLVAQKIATMAQAVAEGVVTVATWAWNAAQAVADALGAPVVLVVLAIVAAVGLLIAGIRLLVTNWSTVWGAIKSIAATVWGWLKAAFGNFMNAMKVVWDTVSGLLRSGWETFWSRIKGFVIPVWDFLKSAWQSFWDVVKTVAEAYWSALKAEWDAFWSAVKALAEAFWTTFKLEWQIFWDFVRTSAEVVWDVIKTAFKVFWEALKLLWTVFKDFFTGDWSGLWNAVKTTASNIWNDIRTGFSSFWNDIVGGVSTAVTDVENAWNRVVDVFKGPVNALIGIWDSIAGVIGLPQISKIGGSSPSPGNPNNNQASVKSGRRHFATGGRIAGPGTGTSDSVPIWASHGEYVMPASTVQHYGLSVMESMRAKKFSIGGLISKAVHGVAGVVSGPLNALKSIPGVGSLVGKLQNLAATAVYDVAKPIVDAVVRSVPDPFGGMPHPIGDVPRVAVKALADAILNKARGAQSQAQSAASVGVGGTAGGPIGGSIPSAQHMSIIDAALARAGVPQSQWGTWERGLNTLITRESGWNPRAINLTDSNAKAGHPSQGLMQTIPSTFAAYGLGGSITDPVSNVVAGIRYIKSRYGDITHVQQANANLPPRGYDSGGPLPGGLTLVNNTTGLMEGVLNPRGLAAIGGLGALSALNSGSVGFMSATSGYSARSSSVSTRTVSINMPITVNAQNANASDVVDEVERRVLPQLTMMFTSGAGSM